MVILANGKKLSEFPFRMEKEEYVWRGFISGHLTILTSNWNFWISWLNGKHPTCTVQYMYMYCISVLLLFEVYLPTFSDAKAWDFHQDIVESLRSYQKTPTKTFQKFTKTIGMSLIRSQDIICQAQLLLFRKSENLPWKNCHLHVRALFQSIIALNLQITHFHITYFSGICQIWLQQLILTSKAWWAWDWKFFICRPQKTHTQGVRVGRYTLMIIGDVRVSGTWRTPVFKTLSVD